MDRRSSCERGGSSGGRSGGGRSNCGRSGGKRLTGGVAGSDRWEEQWGVAEGAEGGKGKKHAGGVDLPGYMKRLPIICSPLSTKFILGSPMGPWGGTSPP